MRNFFKEEIYQDNYINDVTCNRLNRLKKDIDGIKKYVNIEFKKDGSYRILPPEIRLHNNDGQEVQDSLEILNIVKYLMRAISENNLLLSNVYPSLRYAKVKKDYYNDTAGRREDKLYGRSYEFSTDKRFDPNGNRQGGIVNDHILHDSLGFIESGLVLLGLEKAGITRDLKNKCYDKIIHEPCVFGLVLVSRKFFEPNDNTGRSRFYCTFADFSDLEKESPGIEFLFQDAFTIYEDTLNNITRNPGFVFLDNDAIYFGYSLPEIFNSSGKFRTMHDFADLLSGAIDMLTEPDYKRLLSINTNPEVKGYIGNTGKTDYTIPAKCLLKDMAKNLNLYKTSKNIYIKAVVKELSSNIHLRNKINTLKYEHREVPDVEYIDYFRLKEMFKKL